MMSKSCIIKGNQKTFYLQLDQAASCCASTPVNLDNTKPITFYTNLWNQEKLKLEQGEQLSGCTICWEDENANRLSYRQTTRDMNYNVIEIFLTNSCNHMCSYCSPKFSSLWEDSIKTYGLFKNISRSSRDNLQINKSSTNTDYWLNQIEEYINTQPDNSVSIKLLGGEPLMQQRNLEHLLTLNSKKIKKLLIHTNLNPPNNKFLCWILETFPAEKLQIDISIDASIDYNHIVRAGFNSIKFKENLDLLKKYNITYKIISVISVLSIFDIVNFNNWNINENNQIAYQRVHNPLCFDPVLVPFDIRQEILSQLDNPSALLQNILSDTTPSNKLRLIEQHNYLTEYFKRATIDITKVKNELFQRWWAWLEKTVKL